jgi:hypothetical protein
MCHRKCPENNKAQLELFIKRKQGERFALLTEVVRGIPPAKGIYPELEPVTVIRKNTIMEESSEDSDDDFSDDIEEKESVSQGFSESQESNSPTHKVEAPQITVDVPSVTTLEIKKANSGRLKRITLPDALVFIKEQELSSPKKSIRASCTDLDKDHDKM